MLILSSLICPRERASLTIIQMSAKLSTESCWWHGSCSPREDSSNPVKGSSSPGEDSSSPGEDSSVPYLPFHFLQSPKLLNCSALGLPPLALLGGRREIKAFENI